MIVFHLSEIRRNTGVAGPDPWAGEALSSGETDGFRLGRDGFSQDRIESGILAALKGMRAVQSPGLSVASQRSNASRSSPFRRRRAPAEWEARTRGLSNGSRSYIFPPGS